MIVCTCACATPGSCDPYDGAPQAISHLLARGHRSTGYLGGVGNRSQSVRRRFDCERDTLAAHGLAATDAWFPVAARRAPNFALDNA